MKIGEHEIPDEPAARNQWQRGIVEGWNALAIRLKDGLLAVLAKSTDPLCNKELETVSKLFHESGVFLIPTGKEGGDEQAVNLLRKAKP